MIELDHVIVASRDRVAAARQLAGLLGVPWEPTALGVFAPVYVNDGLTLEFITTDEAFPVEHFAFRVGDAEFDAILERLDAANIGWRATPQGPNDRQVGTMAGGRNVYWDEPDGHRWEILTVSYARQSS
ncbi:VOC family protein [Massilia niabensis]|uniref:VOC family protein n=1 Tax=Massilia niabensis TaxID=544910 RepID=A0ABW0L813_9BURK